MSFSKDVKVELSKQISSARHCGIAEIAAIISMCGRISINEKDEYFIKIHTENIMVARKYGLLIKKVFLVNPEVVVRRSKNNRKSKSYSVTIKQPKKSLSILKATKLIDVHGEINENLSMIRNMVVQNNCCKRAFIRGAFLAAGSMSDPEKTYHFEIVVATDLKAKQLQEIINSFNIDAKIIQRKKYFVVYIKEGSQIVDILNIMSAHVALMDFENIRIIKDMRNSINRQVNCEAANINKTVIASTKQIDDIIYIKNQVGLSELSDGLYDIANLRIEYPEASLKELGELLSPSIGKSGVNHRLRKLSIYADCLREQKEEISHGVKKDNN